MADMVQVRRSRQENRAPEARIGRSQFNRSHGIKTTFDASYLVPILVDEVLPGDTFTCSLNGFARIFSPLDAPVMDNIELETLFFFVPTRLIWGNWEAFNGAHDAAGAQDTDYTIPVVATGVTVDHDGGTAGLDLMAYMGIPHGLSTSSVSVNSLPLRAYNLIYNEWFRDQNVKAQVTVETGNGPDSISNYGLRKSAKKHDYFTSCLPYLQKADAVSATLTGRVAVATDALDNEDVGVYQQNDGGWRTMDIGSGSAVEMQGVAATEYLYADFSLPGQPGGDIGGITINGLRQAVGIQRLLEKDARGGTRYVEIIKAHFGVTSPDFRLQRPEYLGGGKSYINVAPVANTSATATEDQGELRGVGTGVISGHRWAKSFVEHGYIIGLVRARGDVTYFQGLDRLWSRSTRYDFYVPDLAGLGEQSVLNKELYVSNDSNDDLTFGYQARWEEYRTKKSMITGLLNPDATGAVSQWHVAEDFGSLPTLNTTFIEDQTPMSRVTTVDTGPDFLLDLWFDYRCARPIPVYGIPSLMGPRF
jgi:hypothetical protein